MQLPFVVDIFTTDSDNNVKKRRLSVDSVDSALRIMEIHRSYGDVTRIVISKRIGGSKNVSKMKVWARNLAS